MGKRLYVGNLPYDADEDAIRAAFSEGGRNVVRVHIPLDRETQRPRGFAFVEMASDEEAAQALAALNGATLGARSLRVSEAEDRRGGPGGGPGGGRSGGGGGFGGPRGGYGDRPPRDRARSDGARYDGARSDGDGGRDDGHGGGGYGGGDGDGGGAHDDRDPAERAREARERRFGPDARPARERHRDQGRKGRGRRRHEDEDGGGRRGGGGRFEDDDD